MEAPNLVTDFLDASSCIEELPTTKTPNATKIANAALDRHEHDASTAATRVVSAHEVFVSRPDSGEPYAGHPRAAEYAKGLKLLTDDPNRQCHFLLKLTLVGDSTVGKSSYLRRLTDKVFLEGYTPTLGVDWKVKDRGFCDPVLPLSMESSPVGVKLQIWDMAGSEESRPAMAIACSHASGYFLFFDVSNRYSFENVPRWVNEMRRYGCGDIPAVLIGMKQDIARPTSSPPRISDSDAPSAAAATNPDYEVNGQESYRQVSYDEGLAMAQQFDMPYVECSAKDDVHIEDALATLVYHIMRSRADLQRGVQEDELGLFRDVKLNNDPSAGAMAAESRRPCVVS